MFLTISLLTTMLFASNLLAADEAAKKAAVAKQKTAMDAAIQKAAIKSVSKAETEHLLVYATRPDSKVKPIAELAQKSFAFAAKSLKVENVDDLFAGKLVVLVVPDRKPFANLVFAIDGKRPDQMDTYELKSRGDLPFVAVGTGVGENPSDAELAILAASWTAATVLNKKLGTDPGAFDLPEWAQLGYGKIVALRAEASSTKLLAFRSKSKALVNGRFRGPVKITELWSGTKGKEHETFAMSVVEYFAFGPDPDRFNKLMMGFKKSDTNPSPTIENILAGLEWKWDSLDTEWKTFVLKAK